MVGFYTVVEEKLHREMHWCVWRMYECVFACFCVSREHRRPSGYYLKRLGKKKDACDECEHVLQRTYFMYYLSARRS